MSDLEGKSVLITGSSTGIGAAAAVAFGERGTKVAVHGNRNRDRAEAVADRVRAAGGEAITLLGTFGIPPCRRSRPPDTRGVRQPRRADQQRGRPDRPAAAEEVEDAFVLDVFQVNALSVIAGCRAAVPLMRAGGGGAIINLSSIAARTGGSAGLHWYAASRPMWPRSPAASPPHTKDGSG